MKTVPFAALVLLGATTVAAQDTARTVYRCPGPPVLYTDALTPQEARERNCRTIEGAPVTIVQQRAPAAASAPPAPAAARPAETRVDPAAQRARDSDARRILTQELRREEQALAELRKEYNNGEPERLGDERNYQKYLDRVQRLKDDIGRSEANIASLRRELAALRI
jgi:Xaa-Pro aminopeptidase